MNVSVDPRAWQRFRRNKGAVVGLVVVATLVLFALVGPILSAQDPNAPDFDHGRARFGMPAPPSALHWLGTDVIFRDELARLAAGARFSLEVGLAATLIAVVIGTAVGVISGWYKGTRVPIDLLVDVTAAIGFAVSTIVLVFGADVTGWRLLGLASYLALAAIVVRAVGFTRWAVRRRAWLGVGLGLARVVLSLALLALPFVPRVGYGHRAALGVVVACAILFGLRRLRPPKDLEARRLHVDLDDAMMRAVDVLLAFPFLLLLMAIAAAVEHTTRATVFLVLGLTAWTGTARIIRSKTLQVREHEFIVASRALGQSTARILLRHVVPNVAGLAVVLATNTIAAMIVAEAALSFLGLSIPPPSATWGRMLDEGRAYYSAAPWLLAAPAVAIVLAVLGFNLLGEGLRDALDARD